MEGKERIKFIVKRFLRKLGFELIRSRPDVVDLILSLGITVVFDVGANEGQFAEYLRARSYTGKIVSFEPLSIAFDRLRKNAAGDPMWEAVRLGLGNSNGTAKMNVSRSTQLSSILPPGKMLKDFAASRMETVAIEEIPMNTLDSQMKTFVKKEDRVFVKVDTQGYEKFVIDGAAKSLPEITALQLELSLTPLYNEESPMSELLTKLERAGYKAALIDSVCYDAKKNLLLQVDCVFVRESQVLG